MSCPPNALPIRVSGACISTVLSNPAFVEKEAGLFTLAACPPLPLDLGMVVRFEYVPEPDIRHFFPTASRSPRPFWFETIIWGTLVGVRLYPAHKIIFDVKIGREDLKLCIAHLRVDVYPGMTVDRDLWCSLAMDQFRERLLAQIQCNCYRSDAKEALEQALVTDPIRPEIEEKWDDSYQIWTTDESNDRAEGGTMDRLLMSPLLPPSDARST